MSDPISVGALRRYQQLLKARNASGMPIVDGTFLDQAIGQPIKLDAFSGTDMQAVLVMPTPSRSTLLRMGVDPDKYIYPTTKIFAELQTISISSARSVAAVRRMGEVQVAEYLRGPRTIAGTMVFTTFSRDVFAEFYRLHGDDQFDAGVPMHVDQIPEFNVLIQAVNEFGTSGSMALVGVTLTNFGTTLSVHDMYLESTYTYVARMMYPFVKSTIDFKRILTTVGSRGSSALSDHLATYDGATYKFGRPAIALPEFLVDADAALIRRLNKKFPGSVNGVY